MDMHRFLYETGYGPIVAWWIPAGIMLGVGALDSLLGVRLPGWAGAVVGSLCLVFLASFSIIGVIACGCALFTRRWGRVFSLFSLGLLSLFLFFLLFCSLIAVAGHM